MALTRKIFYTSIFTTNDFRTQTCRERERERERAQRETRESEIGLALSGLNHHPNPKRAIELAPARSSREIAP